MLLLHPNISGELDAQIMEVDAQFSLLARSKRHKKLEVGKTGAFKAYSERNLSIR